MHLSRTIVFRHFFMLFMLSGISINASTNNDSLLKQAAITSNSKELIGIYNQLGNNLRYAYPDSALIFYKNSLKLAKASNNKTLFADALGSISSVWAIKNEFDSARFYCQQSVNLNREIDNREGLAKSLNSFGLIELQYENYPIAKVRLLESIELGLQLNDSNLVSKAYNNLGLLFKRKHNYDSALYFYLESLKIKELLFDLEGAGATANNIGLIYTSLKEYALAEKYINQSLTIRKQTKNRYAEAMVLNNYGLLFENKGDLNQALKKYQASLLIMEELKKPDKISILYNNIGSVYIKTKDFKKAHEFLQKALETNTAAKNTRGQINSLLSMAKFFEDLRIYQNAISYYKQAMQLTGKIDDIELISQVYEGLFTCYEQNYKFDSALYFYKQFTLLNDSIFNTYSKRNIEKLEIEYQSLKKEKENQDLFRQNQLKEEKLTRFLWIGIALTTVLGVLILAGFSLISGKQKLKKTYDLVLEQRNNIQKQSTELKKAYQKLEEFTKVKEELTSMIVHDLKNPLNIILNIAKTKDYPNRDKVVHHAGKQMMNLIMNILDVYKYQGTEFLLDRRRIYINKVIYDIKRELEFILAEKSHQLITQFEFDYQISVDILSFERIIVNLLTNAIKFSPPGGKITVQTETINPKIFRLHVIVSGEGISPQILNKIFEKFLQHESRNMGFSGSTGIGLAYCKMAVEAHGWKIGVNSPPNNGADFYIDMEFIDQVVASSQIQPEQAPIQISNENRKMLYPIVISLVDKDIFEVSEIKNILKTINRTDSEVEKYCQQIENSVINCNKNS